MKKIERFLVGVGLPNFALENHTTMTTGQNWKTYGDDVTIHIEEEEEVLELPETRIYGRKNIRKALIFLSKYSEKFGFDCAIYSIKTMRS